MKVILFGASGMVGQGVLRECLLDPGVTEVLSIGRSPLSQAEALLPGGKLPEGKLREIVQKDVGELAPVEQALAGYDACFFCLGVSSAGMSEADYTRITYDLTLRAAQTLARQSPGMTFIYVSGAGTDSTERGGSMWARVKGKTENALLRLPFRAGFMFRPGLIQALHGITSRTPLYRTLYVLLRPGIVLAKALFPKHVTTTERIGLAMLRAARHGAPQPLLDPADINALAALGR